MNTKIWWWPNALGEPIEIETFEDDYGTTRLLTKTEEYCIGSEINFGYASKEEAKKETLRYYIEQETRFNEKAASILGEES